MPRTRRSTARSTGQATRSGRAASDDEPPDVVHAVYKPIEGERPLDDFPDGTLANREVAAWLVSDASGLGVVPPTVLRDGRFGLGMLQLWIDVDPEADPLMLVLTRDRRLRPIALLDLVLNNADRKGGHLLPTTSGAVLGCDHGICFSSEPKLRTVLWGWAGEPFDDAERETLALLRTALDAELGDRLGHPPDRERGRRDPPPARRAPTSRPLPRARPRSPGHPLAPVLEEDAPCHARSPGRWP